MGLLEELAASILVKEDDCWKVEIVAHVPEGEGFRDEGTEMQILHFRQYPTDEDIEEYFLFTECDWYDLENCKREKVSYSGLNKFTYVNYNRCEEDGRPNGFM